MTDTLILAAAFVAAVAILALTASRAWRGWLELRRLELGAPGEESATGLRIELAALRERLRRLERIADGVEP